MKKRIFKAIVKHRKGILIFFLLAAIAAGVCKPLVEVNYDMSDYLPEESPSTVALDVMQKEYNGDIPNARVMLKNVSMGEALTFKEKLRSIDGVTDVVWLDDVISVEEPLETQDRETVENYYKDHSALFTVSIASDKRVSAVNEIQTLLEEKDAMTGSAVSVAYATTSTINEIRLITIFAVLFVLFVLTLTTTSWLEPLLIMIGLGAAIIINAGSNLIFGEISFVTNAAGTILQLAIALDFSVFLIHRFHECRRPDHSPAEDMVEALSKASTAIFSSALTVTIGFLALAVMQFKIGPDLGFALAKGMAISLITVFTFTPALLVLFDSWVQKTKHRSFMPNFSKLGRAACKLMIPLVCIFALLPIPTFFMANNNSYYYGSSHIFEKGTVYGEDTAEIDKLFGEQDTYVLMVPKGNNAKEAELSAEIKKLPQVSNIISYTDNVGETIPDEYPDNDVLSQLRSDHYSRMILSIDAPYEGNETFELVREIRNLAQKYYPNQYKLAGEGVSTYDLMETISADRIKVELIAVAAVIIVLLIAFRSVSLPILLILTIETAIWTNLSIPFLLKNNVFYISYLIISAVQLGATVDYAILFTDRYKEFRQNMNKKKAVKETIATTFVPITTSGSALTVCGFLIGSISSHGILAQLGNFLGIGTIFSMIGVFFILPGLLCIFDKWIQKTTKSFYTKSKEA